MHAYADEPQSATDAAFEGLYRRYARDVYRYTLAVLRNPADAEDVTQTTFLNAYRAFKRGEDPIKPRHWLIKIAHNVCRSRYAQNARRPSEVPLDESLSRLPLPADDAIDLRALLTALGELPFRQRAALVLREVDGRSYREIAETLDVTIPAVETLIFRARRRMRAQRAAFQALGAVQLPASLTTFFEGGGAIAGGGVLLGSGLALKAALVVAAGVVAGGVATKELTARADSARPQRVAASMVRSPSAARGGVVAASVARNRTGLARFAARPGYGGRDGELPGGARDTGSAPGVAIPGERAPTTESAADAGSSAGDAAAAAVASATPASSTSSASSGPVPTSTGELLPPPTSASSAVGTVTSTVSTAVSGATSSVTTTTLPSLPSPTSVVDTVTSVVDSVTSLVPSPPPPPTLP
jgi:RNA polymerase sigma factor (sigma-70 family)